MNDENNKIFEKRFDISKNIKKSLLNNLSNSKSKLDYSHRFNGRWENQYLDIDFVPEIKIILDFACQLGRKIINKALIIPNKRLGFQNNEFWFNISKPGESTGWHDHKIKSRLSGVYYIKIPDRSGNIRFRYKNKSSYKEWSLDSEENKMILFNSDLEHCVERNNSDEKRISLAFNLYTFPIDWSQPLESNSISKFY